MAQPWEADVELSPEQAARLIDRQFPELAPARLEPLGAGWDNWAWRVNDHWVFRFPRRRLAAGLLANEIRFLPRIAPRLTLPVPVPEHAGCPEGAYPYPFAGYRLLPGTTACSVRLTATERLACAVPLARFLSSLHGVPTTPELAEGAPDDGFGRSDLPKRAAALLAKLEQVEPHAPELDGAAIRALVQRLARTPRGAGPPRWVHGDLYARHLLVDAQKTPCGVLDWGDLHLGDPALDLSIAFSFLPPEARAVFRTAYGPVDDDTWARARFRALGYGLILLDYGREVGDGALLWVGRIALEHAVP